MGSRRKHHVNPPDVIGTDRNTQELSCVATSAHELPRVTHDSQFERDPTGSSRGKPWDPPGSLEKPGHTTIYREVPCDVPLDTPRGPMGPNGIPRSPTGRPVGKNTILTFFGCSSHSCCERPLYTREPGMYVRTLMPLDVEPWNPCISLPAG